MRLALWQGAGVSGDIEQTVAETAQIATLAKNAGVDLLVFPEGFLTGYYISGLASGDLSAVEKALTGVAGIAAEAGLSLVMGTHLDDADAVRNAAVVFSSSGAEIGRYHKRVLFGGWEQATFRSGETQLQFTCCGLKVGVLICYDVEFPELVRAYAQAGVDLVVVPTALMAPHDRIARQIVPVRAMENQIFLGYANRTGTEPGLDFVGLSSIRGPDGVALAEAEAGPQLLIADIDRQTLEQHRAESCYLDDLQKLIKG